MITDLYTVKLLADLFSRIGATTPTTATVGALGDVMLVSADGLTYECTAIVAGIPLTYTWTPVTKFDAKITLKIAQAEEDYLFIQNKAFDLDDAGATVYPSGSSTRAAEMVCYLMEFGSYEGRGKTSESVADRAHSYEKKIAGYPISIVGSIKRYASVL